MPHLTVSDLILFAGEPRIRDLDLAERLGFERPRAIRQIIDRNSLELTGFGGLPRRVANPGPQGGRPSQDTYLNEAQALLICMFARTPLAAEVRKSVIEVFVAWRAGKTVPVKQHHRRPPRRPVWPYSFSLVQQYDDGPVVVQAVVTSRVGLQMFQAYADMERGMLLS